MINNIQELRKSLEKYANSSMVVGIRGLSGVNADKKYRKGQVLARSYDTFGSDLDPRDVGKTNKFLAGTSAMSLAYMSEIEAMDDELLTVVKEAIRNTYGVTYGTRLCVIVGDQLRSGEDEGEWIIGVKDWPTIRGAIYVDDINPLDKGGQQQ